MATKSVIRRGRPAAGSNEVEDCEDSSGSATRGGSSSSSSFSPDWLGVVGGLLKESCGACFEDDQASSSTSGLPPAGSEAMALSLAFGMTPQEQRKHDLSTVALYLLMNFAGYCIFYWIKQPAMLSTILTPEDSERLTVNLAFAFYDLALFSFFGLVFCFLFRLGFILRELLINQFCSPSHSTASFDISLSTTSFARDPQRIARAIHIGFLVIVQSLFSMFVVVEGTVFGDMAAHTYEFDWLRIISDANQQKDLGLSKKDHASRVAAAIALVVAIQAGFYVASGKIASRWRMASKKALTICLFVFLLSTVAYLFFDSRMENHRAEVRLALLFSQYWDPEDAKMHLGPRLHWGKPEDQIKHAVENEDKEMESMVTNRAFDISAGDTGYPMGVEGVTLPPKDQRKNFVIIAAESWRYDTLTEELMPNLMRMVKEDPSCFRSEHHYTSGHVTELGSYGVVYGLPATSFFEYSRRKIPSFPLRVLRENGYVIAAICASFPWGYPNNFVFTQFDIVKLAHGDNEVHREIELFLEERRKDGKNYLLYAFFEDPHYPYTPTNSTFNIKKPYLVKGQFELMLNTKERLRLYWNSYHNTIMSLDDSYRRLRNTFDQEWKSNKLSIVFTGDHGQEMFEHGGFGHAGVTFWNEKVQIPLVMCVPGENTRVNTAKTLLQKEDMLTSHYDIWPTFFDSGNIKAPLPWTTGLSLLRLESYNDRVGEGIIVTGRHFPQNLGRPCAVISRRCKFWFVYTDRTYTTKKIVRVTDIDDQPSQSCSEYAVEGTAANLSSKLMLLGFDRELRRTFIVEMDELLNPETRKMLLPKR